MNRGPSRPPGDELVYRARAVEHRARLPAEGEEGLELPVAWVRWAWPAVFLTLAGAGAFAALLLGGG